MKTNFHRRSLLRVSRVALAAALTSLPLLAANPADVLPDESVAYAESAATSQWNKLFEHPVIKALPVEDLKKAFYELTQSSAADQEEIKRIFEQETGLTMDELDKKSGRSAASFHHLKVPADVTPQTFGLEFSVAWEFDGDTALFDKYMTAFHKVIEKSILKAAEKAGAGGEAAAKFEKVKEFIEVSEADHADVKYRVFKLKETDETKEAPAFVREWALGFVDKMILFSSGAEQVEQMIDRVKSGGGKGSLGASAYYKADHDRTGNAELVMSLHLKPLLELAQEAIRKGMADGGSNLPFNPLQLWTALGADKLNSGIITFDSEATALDVAAILTYDRKPGLLSIPSIPGPGTPPHFLPKDLQSASWQQVDFAKTVDKLEEVLMEASPVAGGAIATGFNMAKEQTGVDIRKDLIGNLGPDIWTAGKSYGDGDSPPNNLATPATFLLAGMGNQDGVIAIKVKDQSAFELALKTIFNKVAPDRGLFETREYQGKTINNIKGIPEPLKIGWMLDDGWFLLSIGKQELLEQILTRMGETSDDHFFAQKAVKAGLDGMKGGQMAAGAADFPSYMKDMFTMWDALMKQAGTPPGLPDFSKLAKHFEKMPLWLLNKAWIEDKHAELRLRFVTKE